MRPAFLLIVIEPPKAMALERVRLATLVPPALPKVTVLKRMGAAVALGCTLVEMLIVTAVASVGTASGVQFLRVCQSLSPALPSHTVPAAV